MTEWLEIQYRGFYDIPRIFVVQRDGDRYLFVCQFDDSMDDYAGDYVVYCLSDEQWERLRGGSWLDLPDDLERVGLIPTASVTFDASKRRAVNASVFELLGARS